MKEGYYDLVFISGSKPVATLPTRFCNEEALIGKSGAEPEQIQKAPEPLRVK